MLRRGGGGFGGGDYARPLQDYLIQILVGLVEGRHLVDLEFEVSNGNVYLLNQKLTRKGSGTWWTWRRRRARCRRWGRAIWKGSGGSC